MAVTIQQIAELAGVSRGTVDRALNNRGRIRPEVAEKVRQIADELGYSPRNKAIKVNSPEGKIKIGVVTQLCNSSFMIQVNRGIKETAAELKERHIEIIMKECERVDEGEQLRAIAELEAQGISGLAVMPVECDGVRIKINELSAEQHIPVITFNSDIIGTRRTCFVGLDNKKSGLAAAGLMGMMTGGSGKVLVITGFFSNSVNSLRVDGFVEELKNSFPGMELTGVQGSFDNTEEVERIIINTIELFPDLAGIFVASGGQAGIQRAFAKLRLKKRPFVIIYDKTPKNEAALLNGDVDFLIDQEGYVQGQRPLLLLADLLQKNIMVKEEFYFTNINILTKYNI